MDQTIKTNSYNSNYTKYIKNKTHLLRFIVVGCLNTGIDLLAFIILYNYFDIEKLLCQSVAYSLGITNSFILNKLWTFENKSTKYETTNQSIKFIIVNIVSLVVSLLGLKLLNENYGLNIYISKLVVTIIAQVINYLGYKLWVFRTKIGVPSNSPI